MSEPESTEVLEAQAPPPQDYDRVITPGDYWVRGSTQVIALVLEANEFGVIFQTIIIPGAEDEAIFDFEAGQTMMTVSNFRAYLKETQAEILEKTDRSLLAAALKVYHLAKAESRILDAKILPRNQEEFEELEDIELYRNRKQIIPPPRIWRNKKALHWLKAGPSGSMIIAKLWDPELENWVYGNGQVDITAAVGIVSGYHSVAVLLDPPDAESFPEFVARFGTFLKTKGFLLDIKFLGAKLRELTQLKDDEEDHGRMGIVISEKKDGIETVPYFVLSYGLNTKEEEAGEPTQSLNVYLTHNDVLMYHVCFPEVHNKEFIPNQDLFAAVYK